MTFVELISWQICPDTYRLEAEVIAEDVLFRKPNDNDSDCVVAHGTAYVSLGELSDWPHTTEDRLAFLNNYASWEITQE